MARLIRSGCQPRKPLGPARARPVSRSASAPTPPASGPGRSGCQPRKPLAPARTRPVSRSTSAPTAPPSGSGSRPLSGLLDGRATIGRHGQGGRPGAGLEIGKAQLDRHGARLVPTLAQPPDARGNQLLRCPHQHPAIGNVVLEGGLVTDGLAPCRRSHRSGRCGSGGTGGACLEDSPRSPQRLLERMAHHRLP
jgi:hypothetical protein